MRCLKLEQCVVVHVPDLRKAITSKDLNKVVQALIVAAGPKAHKAADIPDTSTLFMENYDVDWTCNVQLFTRKTRQQLQDVITYRHDTTSTHYMQRNRVHLQRQSNQPRAS